MAPVQIEFQRIVFSESDTRVFREFKINLT